MTTLIVLALLYLSGCVTAWISQFTIASDLHWSVRAFYVVFWPLFPFLLLALLFKQWLSDKYED